MGYVATTREQVPQCALVRNNAQLEPRAMGDLSSGFSSFAQGLGMTPGTLLLVGGGALVLGYAINSLFTNVGKKVRKTRRAMRRKREQAGSALSSVIENRVLVGAVLVGAVGLGIYLITRNSGNGGQA
jgi:hypothetical protein